MCEFLFEPLTKTVKSQRKRIPGKLSWQERYSKFLYLFLIFMFLFSPQSLYTDLRLFFPRISIILLMCVRLTAVHLLYFNSGSSEMSSLRLLLIFLVCSRGDKMSIITSLFRRENLLRRCVVAICRQVCSDLSPWVKIYLGFCISMPGHLILPRLFQNFMQKSKVLFIQI